MKKFISKNLAVILSFAIVLCTLLPVMSGVVGAAEYDAAAIAELKAAWADLTVTYEFVPTEVWDGSLNQGVAPLGSGLNVYDASAYTDEDLADKSVLGSKYATYNVALASASDWKDYVVYKLANGSVTDFDVTQFKNFSLYVKSASGIAARPRMHISSDATPIAIRWNDPSFYNADVFSTGAWKKISMSDLSEVNAFINCLTNYSNPTDYKIQGLGFDLTKTGATGEVVTGSASLEMSAASATTLGLAETDAAAFVAAAKDFQTLAIQKNYFDANDEKYLRFKNALVAFAEDEEAAKIEALKNAWAALTVETYFIPDTVWSADNTVGTGLVLNDSSAYTGADVDVNNLGPKYATYSSLASGASNWQDYVIFHNQHVGSSLTLDKLKGYTVYVKAASGLAARPYMHFENDARKWNDFSYYDATQFGTGSWLALKMSDLPEQHGLWSKGSSADSVKTSAIKAIGFDISGVGDITVGSMKVQFAAVNAETLALSSTDAAAFESAAKAFLDEAVANSYFAADDVAFTAFKDALNNALGDEAKVDNLKSTWEALTVETYFIPDTVWSAQDVVGTGLVLNDSSAYTGVDVDVNNLGPKFATYHSNATGASYFDDYIVFNNQFTGTSLTLDKLKGYSVYMKSSDTMALRPKMHFENGAVKWYDFNLYDANQIGVNTWVNLKMSDLPQQNNLWASGSSADSVKTSAIKAIGFDLSGIADVTVGSMKVQFAAVNAETLALAASNSDAFIEAANDFYTEAVANSYFAADDTSFIAFKEALTAVAGDVDAGMKITELKAAWSDLSVTREFIPDTVWNGYKIAGSGIQLYDTSAYTGTDLTDKSVLGSKYATYTVVKSDIVGGQEQNRNAGDWKDHIIFSSVGEDSTLGVKNLKGYSVYIKSSDSSIAARPKAHLANNQILWNDASFYLNDKIGSSGTWVELKMTDLPEQSKLWSKADNSNLSQTDALAGIGFDFTGEGEIVVGTMKATFDAVNADTLALATTNADAFIVAAEAFLEEAEANGYYADDDAKFLRFKAAVTAAAGEPTFEKLASRLSNVWQKLRVVETLVPSKVWAGNYIVAEGLNVYDASAYAGTDLADKSVLGPKYATYTTVLNDKEGSDASDWWNYIVFEREDGSGTALNIGKFESFSVYIKNGTGVGVRPRFHTTTGLSWNDPSFYNETVSLKDTWVAHTTNNISQPAAFKNCYATYANQKMTGIGFDFSGNSGAQITVGSMEAVFTAVDAATLDLANTNPTAFLAEVLYFYDSAVTGGIFGEDDTDFKQFAGIVDSIKNLEGIEEELAIAQLMSEWKQLDLSTYPTVDTTNWTLAEWVYAANKIDISGFADTTEFTEALKNATELRDELGMQLGCNLFVFETYEDAESELTGLGENVLTTVTPQVNYYDGTDKTELSVADTAILTDGLFDAGVLLENADFSAEGSYVEFIYSFDGAAEINDFVVGFINDAELSKVNYRIYASKKMETLFTDSSIVASHDNTTVGYRIQKFNYSGKPSVSGTHLAFRFYGNANGLNVSELAAYGKVSTYNVTAGFFTDADMTALGDNLLDNQGVVTYIKERTSTKVKWHLAGTDYDLNNLIDSSNDTAVGFGKLTNMSIFGEGEEISLHIIFDLKENYYIEKLLINHWHEKYLQTGKYEIYASTEMSTLNRSNNKIIEYNNMADSENGTTEAQIFTAMGDGKIARFVDFHITVPVNDYKDSIAKYGHLCYPRLCDLGVYGSRYYKPYAEINFLPHVPVELYRSDAGGNKTTIGQDEYGYDEYQYAYDGNYDVATPIAQNGKNINFIFNLCANKMINSIKLSALTENIKGLKVYASDTLDNIWSEDTKVMDYSGDAVKEVSRTFAEAPVAARYIRFCITDTASGVFDPTEFEVIGGNTQEFLYMNLMEEKSDSVSLWLEDKKDYYLTSTYENANEYNSAWNAESIYGMSRAFDGDEGSVADFYGGTKNSVTDKTKVTYSFLMDLGNLMAIDSIDFIAGSSKDYWPSELKFYFGEDDISLFGKDAKPAKVFNSKSDEENGSYSYEFLPEIAQYVRVEVVEASHEYYDVTDFLTVVVAELQVNGLEIIGFSASEGVAATATDEETGIRVDVVALRDNDVYTALHDILVIKREATAEEKKALAAQGAIFGSDIYDIFLLDVNENIISDLEGRELKIYLPSSLFKGSGDPYVLASINGEYTMVDFITEDDYFVVASAEAYGLSYAFSEFANIEEETEDNDTPTDTDNIVDSNDADEDLPEDEDDFGDEDESADDSDDDEDETDDEDDEDETKKKKKKKIKVVRKGDDGFDYLWIIIAAAAVVVIAAGITLFIILKKKKNKENNEE